MERLLSKGRRLTTYGEGVALFCHPPPPLTHSHRGYKLDRGATPVPPAGSLSLSHTRTQDPAASADLVSSYSSHRRMTKKTGKNQEMSDFIAGGTDMSLTRCLHLTNLDHLASIILILFSPSVEL